VPACRIIIKQMQDEQDVTTARVIVKLAQDLIQKGFPDVSAGRRAEELRKELVALGAQTAEAGELLQGAFADTGDDDLPLPGLELASNNLGEAPGSLPSGPNGSSPNGDLA